MCWISVVWEGMMRRDRRDGQTTSVHSEPLNIGFAFFPTLQRLQERTRQVSNATSTTSALAMLSERYPSHKRNRSEVGREYRYIQTEAQLRSTWSSGTGAKLANTEIISNVAAM